MTEHKAGRELDALMHKEVFEHELEMCPIHHRHTCCGRSLPNYSTQIADAWLVVEKMGKLQMQRHVGPSMLHRLRECATKGWGVIWCSDFGYTQEVFADTAPLAICLAALKAVENE